MADQAIITRAELAELLATSQGAISQMAYKGELPQLAFPGKRRACWFTKDIREWLNRIATDAKPTASASEPLTQTRIGRRRLPTSSEGNTHIR